MQMPGAIVYNWSISTDTPERKKEMHLKGTARAVSYILKITVIISSLTGIILSAYAGRRSFMGGSTVFMYFTIQSNILAALMSASGLFLMLKRKEAGHALHVIKLTGAVSITLTGLVFTFVLVPVLKGNAWNLQNTLTHAVVPLAFVLDFMITGTLIDIDRRNVFFVVIPPLLYAVYAGIGYMRGWEFSPGVTYPYFFLNWGGPLKAFGLSQEFPFMGTAWWIMSILILIILTALLYLSVISMIRKHILRNKSRQVS